MELRTTEYPQFELVQPWNTVWLIVTCTCKRFTLFGVLANSQDRTKLKSQHVKNVLKQSYSRIPDRYFSSTIKAAVAVSSHGTGGKLFLLSGLLLKSSSPKPERIRIEVSGLSIRYAELPLLFWCVACKEGHLLPTSRTFSHSRAEVAYLLVKVGLS